MVCRKNGGIPSVYALGGIDSKRGGAAEAAWVDDADPVRQSVPTTIPTEQRMKAKKIRGIKKADWEWVCFLIRVLGLQCGSSTIAAAA